MPKLIAFCAPELHACEACGGPCNGADLCADCENAMYDELGLDLRQALRLVGEETQEGADRGSFNAGIEPCVPHTPAQRSATVLPAGSGALRGGGSHGAGFQRAAVEARRQDRAPAAGTAPNDADAGAKGAAPESAGVAPAVPGYDPLGWLDALEPVTPRAAAPAPQDRVVARVTFKPTAAGPRYQVELQPDPGALTFAPRPEEYRQVRGATRAVERRFKGVRWERLPGQLVAHAQVAP